MNSKDAIYSQPKATIGDFCFDEAVAQVFPDMIQRSVPGYSTIINNIGLIAKRYAKDDTQLYDLGCSLGAATLAMRRSVRASGAKIIAIDNSAAMVNKCKLHLDAFKSELPVTVLCDDVLNVDIENASVVVLNFTMQFIEPNKRADLIKKVYQGLNQGGVLILSEKIRHAGEEGDALQVELHHEFKRSNGYSELEISQKRSALENVMLIDTQEQHLERLYDSGFSDVLSWFRCFNFTSMVAIK